MLSFISFQMLKKGNVQCQQILIWSDNIEIPQDKNVTGNEKERCYQRILFYVMSRITQWIQKFWSNVILLNDIRKCFDILCTQGQSFVLITLFS